MSAASKLHEVLPQGQLLEQADVQKLLGAFYRAQGLEAALHELEMWLASVGYFDHLTETNIFLDFAPRENLPSLRLQVNYSRLSYRLPEGARAQTCPLCYENIGSPGKEKLRVLECDLAGTPYFAHPTPFPLHPGHFVLNLRAHEPMRVNEQSLREAAAFVRQAPHWLLASNSDVAWAGASVLGHHHFQIFRSLLLPLEQARPLECRTQEDVEIELLDWPAPVARLKGTAKAVLALASKIVAKWKQLDVGKCTFNYLMRMDEGKLIVHLIFRHPLYVSSPRLKQIKSEGVGVIEMAGEAIVPPRTGCTRAHNEAFFRRHGWAIAYAIMQQNAPPHCHPENMWCIPGLLGFSAELCKLLRKEVNSDDWLPLNDNVADEL
ncbi:MAG: hypothetical protein ACP5QZ_09440 [Candidatus Sumerlaeaceae bacterium]